MPEQITLTTPYVVDPRQAPAFVIDSVTLDWQNKLIFINVGYSVDELSPRVTQQFTYQGDEAKNLMVALNKANLSTKSLHKRILEKLINDGHLAGTISGTPE